MQDENAEWLLHLSGDIAKEAENNYLDAYLVALEGWRRGLVLRWHSKESAKFPQMKTWFTNNPGQLFSLSQGEKTHYFFRSRGDRVGNEAVEIGRDKERTKNILKSRGVKVPEGREFKREESNDTILQYAEWLDFPVVLKPTNGSFGQGVVSNIQNRGELVDALSYVKGNMHFEDVIIEKYIPGKEYRIYVVGDQVVGAINRVPANVKGDGINTIKDLIDRKNEERRRNPRLISCPIIIDDETKRFLMTQDLTLDSVPEKNDIIFLTEKTNISIGGDPIDAFDQISIKTMDSAIKAIQSIPEFAHGAVDMIIDSVTGDGYIIELNPTANLGGLLYPIQGKARDIPRAIIDFYFPETLRKGDKVSKVFFDYKKALLPLQDKTAISCMTTALKADVLYARNYELCGEVDDSSFHQWVKREAHERSLIGYTEIQEKDSLKIVAGGAELSKLEEFQNVLQEYLEETSIDLIRIQEHDGTLKDGFEILDEREQLLERYRSTQSALRSEEKKLLKLEKKYSDMLNSRAWKTTAPLRLLTGPAKNLARTIRKR